MTTMKKHSKQLEKRIEDQSLSLSAHQRLPDRRKSSKCKNGILKNESSPELSRPACRKSRQYFLEPIRRWNSFHNSRERKSTAAATTTNAAASSVNSLPYLQTLVNLQRESKSACVRLAQSVLPKTPRAAAESSSAASAVLDEAAAAAAAGGEGTAAASTRSPSLSAVQQHHHHHHHHHQTVAGSPAKKQNSSPNLLSAYDRRQQGAAAAAAAGSTGGNSLTNSPRRSARRPKTPPPLLHHYQQQQQLNATTGNNAGSCGTDASKIPFAIIVGDSPIVCKDAAVPRIKAIRADSVSEKSSSSYLAAADLSPHRRYSFWSVKNARSRPFLFQINPPLLNKKKKKNYLLNRQKRVRNRSFSIKRFCERIKFQKSLKNKKKSRFIWF